MLLRRPHCYVSVLQEGGEISLWCDSRQPSSESSETSTRKRKQDHPIPTKYDNSKLRLWARMIVGGLHESTDEPPAVPAFHCEQKRRKNSLSGVLTDAAGVLVKYMDRKSSEDLPNPPQVASRLGVSPGKSCRPQNEESTTVTLPAKPIQGQHPL